MTITTNSPTSATVAWTNNEPKAYALYLDRANDSAFSVSVVSEVLPMGTTTFTDTLATTGQYYRVRTVNANGTALSASLQFAAVSVAVGLLAADPDTLERPPISVIPQFGREAIEAYSVLIARKPLPGETQDQYNTRLGTSYPGGSKKALNPYTLERPPEPMPPVPSHESDDDYNARTGRKPLPGETQIAYNTRVPSIPPRT